MTPVRFEALYERYGDGQLTPEELAEFKDALRDPVFQQQLVDLCAYETVVYDELNLSNAEEEARAAAEQCTSGVRSAVASHASGTSSAVATHGSGIRSAAATQASGTRNVVACSSSERIRPATASRRRLRSAARKGQSYWGWSIAAAILLLVLTAFLNGPASPPRVTQRPPPVTQAVPPPEVTHQPVELAHLAGAGDLMLKRGRDRWAPREDAALQAGDRLKTGAKGHAVFVYRDRTQVELGPDTELELQARGEAKRLLLKNGELNATASRQPPDSPMTIVTAHTEATVLGTEFNMLAFDANMRLAVRTGQVRVRKTEEGSPVVVSAGHYVMAAKNGPLVAKPLPEERSLLEDFEGNDIQEWIRFTEHKTASGTVRSWATVEAGVEVGVEVPLDKTGPDRPRRVSGNLLKHIAGKAGKNALEIDFDAKPGDSAGVCSLFRAGQDWSGYDGVKFWVHGQRSMGLLSVEVMGRAPDPDQDQYERFAYEFTDDFTGWREMIIPFRLFKRRADYQPEGAPNDGFTLTEIHGMSFMGSSGCGVFAVDHIELYRK